MMTTLLQDVRYGVRMLVKNPGFTIVAVLALTLGIGADSAIFSVVNAVLLRPLPYDESERLVFLSERSQVLEGMSIAYPNFLDWRAQNNAFESIGVYRTNSYNLTGSGEPERINAGQISADLFTVLRVNAAVGRVFTNDEDQPGAMPVVVLSHALWQRRLGGDPGIIGQNLTLDGRSFTVIGVMPPTFLFPSRAEMWTPVGLRAKDPGWESRGNHPGLYAMARLKPGVTVEQARSDMEIVTGNLEKQYPDSNTGNGATLTLALENVVRDIRAALLVLLSAVGFVLLIACANVANLLLARATNRQKEIAIRTALGASRTRIIRQLLTESMLLSFAGGALGLLLAQAGVKLIVAISPNSIPRATEIGLDLRVVGFTIAVSVLTGVIFGLAPALQGSKPDLNETLKDAGRGSTGRRHILRSAMVVSEVALAMVLLIGAGLMIRSFYYLQRVDPGFVTDNLMTFSVSLPTKKYPEEQQRINFYQQLLQNLRALPGVQSVGMATGLPLGNNGWQSGFWIEGRPDPPQGQRPLSEVAFVSPDYFDTMRMTLLSGRGFTDQDTKAPTPPGAQPNPFSPPTVTIIDEEFAKRYWPDEDPLGQQINFWGGKVTIVGIVRRVKMEGLSTDSNRVQSYYPYLQNAGGGMSIVMRTAGDPTHLANVAREQVLAIDPDQPIYDVQTMGKIWSDSIAPDRLYLMLLGTFAAVALVLAGVGIYGVMAYSVTQRTHEIGIRMALGARQSNVLGMVIRQGMMLAVIGLVIGLAAAWLATRAMASLLFGVSATDPLTFALISVVLAGVALGACFVPALRATKVDPMIALRYE
ncbi:MAG TPA: ABC transporter permease [Blastocatellia bacterium]|nr:ABC transporter permease [Blastocatellia bacterium]